MHIDRFKTDDPDFQYMDSEGVSYQDAEQFITGTVFGFCGCGMPNEALKFVRDALLHIKTIRDLHEETRHETYKKIRNQEEKTFKTNGIAYFAYYVLDKAKLTEHGGSVPGWLTEKGEELLEDLLEMYPL